MGRTDRQADRQTGHASWGRTIRDWTRPISELSRVLRARAGRGADRHDEVDAVDLCVYPTDVVASRISVAKYNFHR